MSLGLGLILLLSLTLFSIVISRPGAAVRAQPPTCTNLYDATVSSLVVASPGVSLNVTAHPGATIELAAQARYNVTLVLKTASKDVNGGTQPGSIAYQTDVDGALTSSCIGLGGGTASSSSSTSSTPIGPNQAVKVTFNNLSIPQSVSPGDIQSVHFAVLENYSALPGGYYQKDFNVVWAPATVGGYFLLYQGSAVSGVSRPGGNVTVQVVAAAFGSFRGAVPLVVGPPPNMTATLSPRSLTVGPGGTGPQAIANATLTLAISPSASAGEYAVVLTGVAPGAPAEYAVIEVPVNDSSVPSTTVSSNSSSGSHSTTTSTSSVLSSNSASSSGSSSVTSHSTSASSSVSTTTVTVAVTVLAKITTSSSSTTTSGGILSTIVTIITTGITIVKTVWPVISLILGLFGL